MPDQNDKSFEIHKMDLHTPNLPSETVSLQSLYTSLRLTENLFLPYISGSITIYDAAGYSELLPLIGEEKLELDISVFDPNSNEPQNIKGLFRITSISPQKRRDSSIGSIYSLSFVSNEYFINLRTRIYDSFMFDNPDEQLKLSTIAELIFNKYIKNNVNEVYEEDGYYKKDIEVEESSKRYQIIFPNLQPFQAILMCTKRAISKNFKGATFVFYETLKSFNFKTIESLFEQEPKFVLNYIPTIVSDGDELDQARIQEEASDQRFIDQFEVIKSFDVFDNVTSGMYSSKLIALDFERLSYREYDYEYVPTHDLRNSTTTVNGKKIQVLTKPNKDGSVSILLDRSNAITNNKLCTQNNDNLNHPNQKIHFTSTNFEHDIDFERNLKQAGGYKEPGIVSDDIEQTKLQRQSQLQQLQNIQVAVQLKTSTTNIQVGDVIKLNMPSETAQEYNANVPPGEHFYYSGNYITSKVSYNLTKEGLITELALSKNSLENPMPDFDLSVLSKEKLIDVLQANQNPELDYYGTPNFARAAKGGGL